MPELTSTKRPYPLFKELIRKRLTADTPVTQSPVLKMKVRLGRLSFFPLSLTPLAKKSNAPALHPSIVNPFVAKQEAISDGS